MAWASGLTVTFNGTIYDDWRLPSTVDGLAVYGYDGTTTVGYNITSSEMGHLFYTELGNNGWLDTSGKIQNSMGLLNTGDFVHLTSSFYWSGTTYSAGTYDAWGFDTPVGAHGVGGKFYNFSALAVRPGDVAAVPEPGTVLLFGLGLVGLAARTMMSKRRRG